MKEITGTVPAATPIILEATSADPLNNKLTLKPASPNKPADNVLSGNYFAFEDRQESKVARTVYNKSTMRVLGLTAAGKLGFVTATNDMLTPLYLESIEDDQYCIPANTSYLKVAAGTPAELTIMTEAEYGALAGIEGVQADEVVAESYYSISGVKLSAPLKGVNIVKYSDGTTRKVIIK
jgi:hypothetical protein